MTKVAENLAFALIITVLILGFLSAPVMWRMR